MVCSASTYSMRSGAYFLIPQRRYPIYTPSFAPCQLNALVRPTLSSCSDLYYFPYNDSDNTVTRSHFLAPAAAMERTEEYYFKKFLSPQLKQVLRT